MISNRPQGLIERGEKEPFDGTQAIGDYFPCACCSCRSGQSRHRSCVEQWTGLAWRLGRTSWWLLLAWRQLGLGSSRLALARGLGLGLGPWLGLGSRLGLARRPGLGSRLGLDLALGIAAGPWRPLVMREYLGRC